MNDPITKKLYGLDHLRALAITFVFLFHYFVLSRGKPGWLPDVAKFGWSGVDLFFVLSGFLISSQLFEQIKKGEKVSFKTFFQKRFFRIIPAYAVVLAIYFCIPFFREKESLPPLWKFLTFTQNLGLNFKEQGTFSHAWSLCVEEYFYLFLPLLLILFQTTRTIKKSYLLVIALFLLGFILRLYSFNELYLPNIEKPDGWMYWYKYVYYPTYNRLDGLLAGVSIAAVVHFLPSTWARISRYGNLWLLLGLGILTGAYFLCYEEHSFQASIFGFPLVAIGYGCLVTGAVSSTSLLYKWKSKVTTFIATLSYSIYLIHKGTIRMTQKWLVEVDLNDNWVLIISILTSIAGALVLHWVIEKPFMKLRTRIVDSGNKTISSTKK